MIVWRVFVLSTQHAICMHACGIVLFPFRHSNVKTLKRAIDINHRLKFIFYASYNCIHTTCRRVVSPCQHHPTYDAACANNAINTFNTDNNVSISHHEFGASLNVNEHWTNTANRATNCVICILAHFETSWHRRSVLHWMWKHLKLKLWISLISIDSMRLFTQCVIVDFFVGRRRCRNHLYCYCFGI